LFEGTQAMAQVTRKDRNRRGGNKSSILPRSIDGDDPCIVHYTPVERKFLKRNGRKAMRKQHAKAVAMALNEAIEDSRLDEFDALLDDYERYDDTPMEEPLWCDIEEEDPYWYADDYGYVHDDLFDVDVYPTIN
jgi:hypothetical protein